MTFHVVGCGDCSSLWILDDSADESASCPTCGTRRSRSDVRSLAKAEDHSRAAQQRSALLAKRQGHGDADLNDYHVQDLRADEPVVDDVEYLDGLGLGDDLVDELTDQDDAGDDTERGKADRRDVGTGPAVDVAVADRCQLHGVADSDAVAPGVTVVDHKGQLGIAGRTYRDVAPRTSEWLDDVLEDVLPSTARLVQDLAADRNADSVESFVGNCLVQDVAGLERVDEDGTLVQQLPDAEASTVEEARSYLDAIARYALLWSDDVYRMRRGFEGEQQFELVEQTLATTGTGRGQFNAGVEAIRHSLCQLHAERDVPLPLTFVLAGEDWTAADTDTVKRALAAFDALADGFDVRLWMSPGVRQRVRRLVSNALDGAVDGAPQAWAERFEFLTRDGRTSRRLQDVTDDQSDHDLDDEAWSWVDDNRKQTGVLCVLANLNSDGDRSMRALRRDEQIDYADGSLERYVPVLEASGLVNVDRSHPSNRLSLTPLGQAAQQFVDPTGSVVHRDQSRLSGAAYGHPSQSRKYSVSPQEPGGDRTPPAERWMAATGDPREDGWVQWLGDRNGPREVEPPVMHRRLRAAQRVEGVNLVDSDLLDWTDEDQAPDGDGRVTYVSVFDDNVQLVAQWGGPAQTMARLCAGLLGNRMLSKALNIDAVGTEWEQTHDGVDTFENDLHEVLTRSQQIGWMSEDDLNHYDNWRDRIGGVRAMLLSKLGQMGDLDAGLRRELFNDLHGLLCSATHLYEAAGMDITATIRMPDVDGLKRNDDAYQHFLDFLRFTVTKQAGYRDENGFHSWYRMCLEDREGKLKSRAAYSFDDDPDPTADLTMSWVLAGPGISSLQEDVEESIAKEAGRLRERVDEGVETAATLDIPIVEANSHARIRGLVREFADRKGFRSAHRDDLDRLTRVLEAALATDDRGPDPYLVADALDSLESRDKPWDSLDVHAIENALASLPAERIFPTLAPSARRMLSALFASDGPLDRQDLIAVTSESSYDRHHKALRAFFLVEEVDGGLVAHLEPWWSSTNDERHPYHEDHPSPIQQYEEVATRQPAPSTRPKEVVLHIVGETDFVDIPPDDYYELGKRSTSWRTVLEELGLQRWAPILSALCDDCHEPTGEPYSDPSGVQIGPPSPGSDPSQATLSKAVADD